MVWISSAYSVDSAAINIENNSQKKILIFSYFIEWFNIQSKYFYLFLKLF